MIYIYTYTLSHIYIYTYICIYIYINIICFQSFCRRIKHLWVLPVLVWLGHVATDPGNKNAARIAGGLTWPNALMQWWCAEKKICLCHIHIYIQYIYILIIQSLVIMIELDICFEKTFRHRFLACPTNVGQKNYLVIIPESTCCLWACFALPSVV